MNLLSPTTRSPCVIRRRGFTLVEMLVVIAIIGMMAAMGLVAMFQSQQSARASRTRATITKLHQAIATRWETYRTRRLPTGLNTIAGTNGRALALMQLIARRQIMRMELPDSWEDITYPFSKTPFTPPSSATSSSQSTPYLGPSNNERSAWTSTSAPVLLPIQKVEIAGTGIPTASSTNLAIPPTALAWSYYRRYSQIAATATPEYQGAECLYMIVTSGMGDESSSDLMISKRDIGDYDNDGAPEFLDGWGRPIGFIRWAPGVYSDLQPQASGVNNPLNPFVGHDLADYHDSFDYAGVDPLAFELFPYIYSAGPDNDPAIVVPTTNQYRQDMNDPYAPTMNSFWCGAVISPGLNGGGPDDNIHNHLLDIRK